MDMPPNSPASRSASGASSVTQLPRKHIGSLIDCWDRCRAEEVRWRGSGRLRPGASSSGGLDSKCRDWELAVTFVRLRPARRQLRLHTTREETPYVYDPPN